MALMCAVPVQDVERIESAKAGAVAAVGGLLGSLPYLATAGHGVASTAVSAGQIFASCLLFGVTFRYVLVAGKDNAQLKGGVVAAFGLVRAADTAGFPHIAMPERLACSALCASLCPQPGIHTSP